MKQALVTGGSGFLGSHISDALTDSGYSVRVFDREESRFLKPDQEMIRGDITDPTSLAEASTDCDVLFHLAGLADLERGHGQPREAAEQNILGTINALEAARQAGVRRFVLASTVYVYSRAGGFYRCSKQSAEAFVEEFGRQFELPFTILRYGSLYGPRSDEANGVRRLLSEAVTSGRISQSGSPEDTREYIHVQDAARLSVEALGSEFLNRHVTITGAHPTRLRDLFVMFEEILGRKIEINYRTPSAEEDGRHYAITPYAYMPRVGRKLTSRHFVDMGQGILELVHEIEHTTTSLEANSD